MIPHFAINQNKGEYLIIRMGDEFHIIDCNEALTKEKRLAVLESGCTPAQMQEMGLSGTTIPKSDIVAITVTGCGFQDDVIFHLKNKKKLSYWFPQAYEQKKVDDFFRGIPRKQVRSRRRLRGGRDLDWRLKEQDEAMYRKLRPVGWVYNTVCALICLYPFVRQEVHLDLHGWLVLAMCLIAVTLDILLPAYFSVWFFEDRDVQRKRRGGGRKVLKTRSIKLGYGLVLVLVCFAMFHSKYNVVRDGQLLKASLILTLAAFLGLILLCREFQELLKANVGLLLVHMLLGFALNCMIMVPHFNHVLGGELTPFTAVITGQHISGGKSDSYFCTVSLPDGRELDIEVTGKEYRSYETGDTLDLQYGTGFFGIDYAIDG